MLDKDESDRLVEDYLSAKVLIRKIMGSKEFINGLERNCLWISDANADASC